MNKRKLDDYLVKSHDKIVEKINHPQVSYHNPANNDTIYIIDNRIVFHSTVTNETIQKLFEYVIDIKNTSNAFSALTTTGTVLSWGRISGGGDNSSVQSDLTDIVNQLKEGEQKSNRQVTVDEFYGKTCKNCEV